MKTFIILFDLEEITDSRTKLEKIEGSKIIIPGIKHHYEQDVFEWICKYFGFAPGEYETWIIIYELTDFMDAFNNEEINETGTFMGYVHVN